MYCSQSILSACWRFVLRARKVKSRFFGSDLHHIYKIFVYIYIQLVWGTISIYKRVRENLWTWSSQKTRCETTFKIRPGAFCGPPFWEDLVSHGRDRGHGGLDPNCFGLAARGGAGNWVKVEPNGVRQHHRGKHIQPTYPPKCRQGVLPQPMGVCGIFLRILSSSRATGCLKLK